MIEISKMAFANNQIKDITVRCSIPNFDTSAFNGNPVQSISLPGDIDNPNFSEGFINLLLSEIIIVTDENSPVHTLAISIKSLICMPIIYHSKSIGILYLENSVVEEVFSASRVDLLKILSS